VACDIRDPEQIAAAFDDAETAFGLPGVLINNAAANFPVPAEDMSPNAWRTVVDITLNGTFFCAREFGRRHLLVGTPGSIVNVGASYAWTGGPGFAHSAAAKAGVKNMVSLPARLSNSCAQCSVVSLAAWVALEASRAMDKATIDFMRCSRRIWPADHSRVRGRAHAPRVARIGGYTALR
jgi:NAD(P)-dependent dehydrogenase (short-subunit alcohol dehydrogenase family)